MTNGHKIVKYFAIALAICLIASIFAGVLLLLDFLVGLSGGEAVEEFTMDYPVFESVSALEIDVGAAACSIRIGTGFSVKSNLKYLSVETDDGVLKIKETRHAGLHYQDPILIIFIPEDIMLDRIELETGAGSLEAETLSAKRFLLTQGAGAVSIQRLCVTEEAEISGGAGRIEIGDGTIRDLQLEMGVGRLELAAALQGRCEFELGVGETALTLFGTQEDYCIDIQKGLGGVTVDGVQVTENGKYGDGENTVEIEGGVGSIRVELAESPLDNNILS